MAAAFEMLEGKRRPDWFAGCDPAGRPLGSGGGTAHLLVEAWRATAPGRSFADWLRQSRKLVLHAGGQSRRLPAYAPTGKLLMPIPVFRWSRGQRLDQSLLDLQLTDYQRGAGPRGAGHRGVDHQRRRAAALCERAAPVPRGRRARPRHVGSPGDGTGLRRLRVPAPPAYRAGVLPAKTLGCPNPRIGGEPRLPGRHGHVAVERTRRFSAHGALRLEWRQLRRRRPGTL